MIALPVPREPPPGSVVVDSEPPERTIPMSTTNVSRAATTGLIGGALWALLPVAWASAHLEDVRPGTLAWFGVAAVYWIFPVLAPLLIVVGLTALRRALGDGAGRLGVTGIAVAAVGTAAMALGNGIEVASMTAGGGEVVARSRAVPDRLPGVGPRIGGGRHRRVPPSPRRPLPGRRLSCWPSPSPWASASGSWGRRSTPRTTPAFWAAISRADRDRLGPARPVALGPASRAARRVRRRPDSGLVGGPRRRARPSVDARRSSAHRALAESEGTT